MARSTRAFQQVSLCSAGSGIALWLLRRDKQTCTDLA